MTITVDEVHDHGSIVTLVGHNERGGIENVNLDHRPYRWIVEAEGDLVGRTFDYENETLYPVHDED